MGREKNGKKEEKGKKKAGEKKSEGLLSKFSARSRHWGTNKSALSQIDPRDGLLRLRVVIPFHLSFSLFSPFLHTLRYLSRFLPPASAPRISSPSTPIPSFPFLSIDPLSFFRPFRLFYSPPPSRSVRFSHSFLYRSSYTVAPPGGRAEASPPYGWTSKNYVICVCFHCHGTSYHTTNTSQGRRAKSPVDTQTIQPGLGDFVL